jgi:hypothetical protein
MKTLKELEKYLTLCPYDWWYYNWYKDAIELMQKYIKESSVMSVQIIENYLEDLLKE